MIATVINAAGIVIGGLLGLLLGKRFPQRITESLMHVFGLCTMTIGIMGALQTENIIHVLICMILGTVIGELLRIEKRIDNLGGKLEARFAKEGKGGSFTTGFLTATLLYCVGSMAIMGSLEAGIQKDYTMLFTKTLMDSVTAIGLAATLGVGVLFSALPLLVYQGAITLASGVLAPLLSATVVTEMGAIGGVLLIGMGINMLFDRKIRLSNMLPGIFLPMAYFPLLAAVGMA